MRSPAARGVRVGVGPPEPEPPRSVNGERFGVAESFLLLPSVAMVGVLPPPIAPVVRKRVGEIDDDDDDFFEGV